MTRSQHGAELGEEIRNECVAAYEMFTAETTDGLLGTIELDKVLRMLGQEPSAQELKSVMDEFANSDNGKMSQDDFLDLMERQLLSSMKGEEDLEKNFRKLLQDSFYWFDKDRDGVLNKKELETAFALIGESLQAGEFEDFFGDCDRNGDGKIDYEEWVKIMQELEGEIKC
jgi:Ca2+-binding EF-hand superfamily protein